MRGWARTRRPWSRSVRGGSYDVPRVRGCRFTCTCGNEWGYANTSLSEARRSGLDRCGNCGRRSTGEGFWTKAY